MGHKQSSSTSDPNDRFRHALTRSDGHKAVSRADIVLRRYGTSVEAAENPRSASNDVWLAGGLCLRMSRRPGPDTLFDEARLGAVLPPQVGYPEVLATGIEDGHQWVLSRRLPGLNLWDSWPAMTHDQRMTAVDDLWHRHLGLQETDPELLANLRLPQPRRCHFDRDEAEGQLRYLVEGGVLEDELAPPLWQLVERGLETVWSIPWRLVHGDPGLTNVQCHNGIVIGLLDLEAACIAPFDLDLDPLLRILADPLDDSDSPGPYGMPDADSFAGVFERLVTAADPVLQLPDAPDRFRCYAVLFDLTILGSALRRGVPVETVRGWSGRIQDMTAHGSYLDRIWS